MQVLAIVALLVIVVGSIAFLVSVPHWAEHHPVWRVHTRIEPGGGNTEVSIQKIVKTWHGQRVAESHLQRTLNPKDDDYELKLLDAQADALVLLGQMKAMEEFEDG